MSDLLDLSSWPEGTRAITRREVAHPGAQLTFTDVDGRRYQVFLTDHPSTDICFLEASIADVVAPSARFATRKTAAFPISPRRALP